MKILVSACLLGIPCRYNGTLAESDAVWALAGRHELVPVCPEQLGGLPTPRQPIELRGDRALEKTGRDVTRECVRGAELAVQLARRLGCTHAILKQNSPTCGCGRIYDGTFGGVRIDGDGLAARALKENGVAVFSDDCFPEL